MPATPPSPPTSRYLRPRPMPPGWTPPSATAAANRTPASTPPRGATAPTSAPAAATSAGSEVYLVGGCHREGDVKNEHDVTAWNYYTSANRVVAKRAAALRKSGSPDKISVIMYEPAYQVRAVNDKKRSFKHFCVMRSDEKRAKESEWTQKHGKSCWV